MCNDQENEVMSEAESRRIGRLIVAAERSGYLGVEESERRLDAMREALDEQEYRHTR